MSSGGRLRGKSPMWQRWGWAWQCGERWWRSAAFVGGRGRREQSQLWLRVELMRVKQEVTKSNNNSSWFYGGGWGGGGDCRTGVVGGKGSEAATVGVWWRWRWPVWWLWELGWWWAWKKGKLCQSFFQTTNEQTERSGNISFCVCGLITFTRCSSSSSLLLHSACVWLVCEAMKEGCFSLFIFIIIFFEVIKIIL